ncbi:TerC family protein, partial [Pseudomonas aeruginosa]
VVTAICMVPPVRGTGAVLIVTVLVVIVCGGAISDFIHKHPALLMLALWFLIVVGTVFIAEAFVVHVANG